MPYFRLTDNSATSPVILHAPHGGRLIPAEHLAAYLVSPAELEAEKNVMTDHFTDLLAAGIAGASCMINELSRFAVDVERFADDTEEMNAVGMGVLYTRGSQGQPIRDLARTDQPALMAHFTDYSGALADLVTATLERHGQAFIIDLHSYPEHALPYELHAEQHAEQPRPELCVGFERFHAPADFVHTVTDAFAHLHAFHNGPFAGAYVPLEHYGTDSRVNAVMLEIRRDVYMNEDTLEVKPEPFRELQECLQLLVTVLRGDLSAPANDAATARCPRLRG
ncbi:N-formylglutamate amidohydrolase [Cryobacterium sp. CG_9.6]|uniref:N-formylglutamate amidohydrolase n=1 Tax=Cryobacterium sp. CG_9.6 TaxID=2760710 RepID=UPI00247499B9|nr:N-formylglutamate amidohydrolase [Cryobacterium sp. CG_9.6]MDH6236343.1 N-formylglutamate amidohydrolase [Cryobacterium sp. CG_9.6]